MPSKASDSLFYIAGSDYFQHEQSKKILDGIEDCETETFDGDDFNAEFFFNFINTPSMFQENKAAVLRAVHKMKTAPDVISKCAGCVETHLIFLSSETKLAKGLNEALKETGFTVLAEKKATKYDTSGRVVQMFSEAGFKIDSVSSMELSEIFGGDLQQIANEIEKLTIYFAYKKPSSSAEIMSAITARKQDNIFQFIDAYTEKKRKVCSVMLGKFIQTDENLGMLINMLYRRMKDVYLFANLNDQLTEKRPWMLEKIRAGARAWKREELVRLYGLFAELDYKFKTGQVTAENYLTFLVGKL